MKAYIIMHVPAEGPGYILDWLEDQGADVNFCKMYESTLLPAPAEVDFLVIMGGPMNLYDELKCPWLGEEKEFIKQCISADKAILGVCLGAQLLADALGEKIFPNKEKEIGWLPVSFSKAAEGLSTGLPKKQTVFHWHGDTFNLPAGAVHLACSEACQNQGFIYRNVLALQFHLEVTPSLVAGMLEQFRSDLTGGGYVQEEAFILSRESYYSGNKQLLFMMLDGLLNQQSDD